MVIGPGAVQDHGFLRSRVRGGAVVSRDSNVIALTMAGGAIASSE
jgi:hypothetical protein